MESFKTRLSKAGVKVDNYNDVTAYLSKPATQIQLPVLAPDELIPCETEGRIALIDGCVVFLGREIFASLVNEYLACNPGSSAGIEVFGNIGSGKTHLLCALVDYIHLRGVHHAVYVPSCGLLLEVASEAPVCLLECLKFSFSEKKLKHLKPTWSNIQRFIMDQPKWSVVFVFDNWHALEESDEGNALKRQLRALALCQYLITARSAGAESAKKLHQSGTKRAREGMRCNCFVLYFVCFLYIISSSFVLQSR